MLIRAVEGADGIIWNPIHCCDTSRVGSVEDIILLGKTGEEVNGVTVIDTYYTITIRIRAMVSNSYSMAKGKLLFWSTCCG